MSKPIMLISAPVATRSGYGNHSRDLIESLIEMDKWDIKIASLRWGDCSMDALDDNNPVHKKIKNCFIGPNNQINQQPDINIDIRVPNEFQQVGKFNIGITAGMETTLVSPEWIEGCNRMDLIIVPSEHSKKTFLESTLLFHIFMKSSSVKLYISNPFGKKITLLINSGLKELTMFDIV